MEEITLKNIKDKKIGITIKKKRLEIGLTQKQLAKELDLSHTYISDIEVGRTIPSDQTLSSILQILEKDLLHKKNL